VEGKSGPLVALLPIFKQSLVLVVKGQHEAAQGDRRRTMKGSNYLNWFRRLLVLGAVVAGVTASSAAAIPMLDPQSSPAPSASSHTTPLGVRADGLRWQAIAKAYQQSPQVAVPDVFERYATAHPYGAGTAAAVGTDRIVDDSFRDPAPIATPAGERVVDDYFRDSPTVVASPTSGNGLDWEDFGIGAGAMFGLTALVIGLGLGAVAMRHRTGRLGTS
jgi:hypothetical protein